MSMRLLICNLSQIKIKNSIINEYSYMYISKLIITFLCDVFKCKYLESSAVNIGNSKDIQYFAFCYQWILALCQSTLMIN